MLDDQVTPQSTVTLDAYNPDCVNVLLHVVACSADVRSARYGVPGPLHTTDPAAPKSHVVRTGFADTVAESPGIVAVLETSCHSVNHNQVDIPTSWNRPRPGEVAGRGTSTESCADAWSANMRGVMAGAAGRPGPG